MKKLLLGAIFLSSCSLLFGRVTAGDRCGGDFVPVCEGDTFLSCESGVVFALTCNEGQCNVDEAEGLVGCLPQCGDRVQDLGEECDVGPSPACDLSCQRIADCGDGLLDRPELCDDGNLVDGDGCSSACVPDGPQILSTTQTTQINGSSLFEGSGDTIFDLRPTSTEPTLITIELFAPGFLPCRFDFDLEIFNRDSGLQEAADSSSGVGSCPKIEGYLLQPNTNIDLRIESFFVPGDEPAAYFLAVSYEECGDGVLSLSEDCDTPNTEFCDLSCRHKSRTCGDQFVDPPESCDDGNSLDGDGCDSACQREEICVCDGEANLLAFCPSGCELRPALFEAEPNDDGSPNLTFDFFDHNNSDFSALNANGPFLGDATVIGVAGVPGDEDSFEIGNFSDGPRGVELLLGTLSPQSFEVFLDLHNEEGDFLLGATSVFSSSASIVLEPNSKLFVHVSEGDDTAATGPYFLSINFSECGDGAIQSGEECEFIGSIPCDAFCQREPVCGDILLDGVESCDDGNLNNGDGCDAQCQLEGVDAIESEPNDDGQPSVNGGSDGDDFSAANADGPFTQDTLLFGALNPVGDEDIFAVTNTDSAPVVVRFDTFLPSSGFGVACLFSANAADTVLLLRDESGNILDKNDNRQGFADACSGLFFTLSPNQTIFAHVVEGGDDDALSYLLQIDFTGCGNGEVEESTEEECEPPGTASCDSECHRFQVCGDGLIDEPEACDDGNLSNGDGCDSLCALEGTIYETEPNEDGSPQAQTNDFSVANAEGPFSATITVIGAIVPQGDEDVFALQNNTSAPKLVNLSSPGFPGILGFDEIFIRDANGAVLATGISPPGSNSQLFGFQIPPNQTVYAHYRGANDTDLTVYELLIEFPICGDGIINVGEDCETPGAGLCDEQCQRIKVCGDNIIDAPETCDDGNTNNGDGCDQSCQLEGILPEREPNDDGSPSAGQSDFSTASAEGPFTSDTIILAAISPAGDEDIFAVRNQSAVSQQVIFRTSDPQNPGQPCDSNHDTDLFVRASNGTELAHNDQIGGGDNCSVIIFTLSPNQTVFVQVQDFLDNSTISSYLLTIDFGVCGDGIIDPGFGEECDGGASCDTSCQRVPTCGDGFLDSPELCDDGNTASNDGCSSSCNLEICGAGQTQLTFAGGGLPLIIPDNNLAGVTNTINVTDTRTIKKVTVFIGSITHTFVGDVALSLIAPNNAAVSLSEHRGLAEDNYTNTLFQDGCPSISTGAPPFTGCFAPEQPLSAITNIPANGAWKLKLLDNATQDEGTLHSWSLNLCVQ